MKRIATAMVLCVSLVMAAVLATPALAGGKVSICHRDQGKPEWKEIEIAESALPAHLAHQWGADIYPVPDGGCPGAEVPTGVPTDVPTEVPTDEPTSTSTPVPTDAPTDVATPTATSAVVESTATPNEPDSPTDTAAPTATATPNQLTETPNIVVPCPVPSGVTCRSGNG